MFYSLFKVIPPAVYLRVTENVHLIIPFIERIIENGHAYATKEGGRSNVHNLFAAVSLHFVLKLSLFSLQATCTLTLGPLATGTASLGKARILLENQVRRLPPLFAIQILIIQEKEACSV